MDIKPEDIVIYQDKSYQVECVIQDSIYDEMHVELSGLNCSVPISHVSKVQYGVKTLSLPELMNYVLENQCKDLTFYSENGYITFDKSGDIIIAERINHNDTFTINESEVLM